MPWRSAASLRAQFHCRAWWLCCAPLRVGGGCLVGDATTAQVESIVQLLVSLAVVETVGRRWHRVLSFTVNALKLALRNTCDAHLPTTPSPDCQFCNTPPRSYAQHTAHTTFQGAPRASPTAPRAPTPPYNIASFSHPRPRLPLPQAPQRAPRL